MVNAGDLFAGAAVGGAFGPVFDVFREVVEKTVAFNPTLKSVKSTVDSLALLIPEIEDRNKILGGSRQGEVKELGEKMEEGKKLIEELLEVNEWNCLKAHYTDQLVDLDESLKRLLEILQVQGVIDVKEGLALTKDISTDAKEGLALIKDTSNDVKKTFVLIEENRNHIIGLDDTLKARLKSQEAVIQELKCLIKCSRLDDTLNARLKSQEVIIQELKCLLKLSGLADKVGSLNEAAALGATLEELHDAVSGEIFLQNNLLLEYISSDFSKIHRRTMGIFRLIEEKRAENKEMLYIPTEELQYFRVQLEEGVNLVRNCPKVLEWTDDLKSEYTNKFLQLNTTLDTLYNRLKGIHLLKWNCGKCAKSCVTTSIRDSPNIF